MVFHTLDLVRAVFSHFLGSRGERGAPRLMESLESRQFLSVAGAADNFFNITGSLVSTTIPTSVATGETVKGAITVAVKNAGTLAFPTHPNEQVTIQILAQKTGGGNTVLATSGKVAISTIAPGSSQNFTIKLNKLPALAAGDYTYAAVITPVQALTESSTTDNTVTTTAANATLPLHVVAPGVKATLGDFSIPTAVVVKNPKVLPGTMNVLVTNTANLVLPSDESVTIVVKAHNTVTHANIVLSVNQGKKYSVGLLGIGKSETISASVHESGKILPAGTYILEAVVTLVQKSKAGLSSVVTLNSADQPITLVSGAATADLTGSLGVSTVVSSATDVAGNLTVTVKNTGNLAIAAGKAVSFTIVARPVGTLDSSLDTVLTTAAQNFTLPALKPGQSATFTVQVTSSTVLSSGNYNLLATIVAPGVSEPPVNNVASQTIVGTPVRVTSTNVPSGSGNTSTGNGNTTNSNTTNSNTTNSNTTNSNTTNSNTTNSNNTNNSNVTTITISNGTNNSNVTTGFTDGTLTAAVNTINIVIANGTMTITNATFGDPLSLFSINDILALEPTVNMVGPGLDMTFQSTPNTPMGTVTVNGVSYVYIETSATTDSLTLTLLPNIINTPF